METSSNSDRLCIALLAGGDSDEREISLRSGAAVQSALSARGHVVVPIDPAQVDLNGLDWSQFDVAFLALHGRFGEDGQVQQLLHEAGIPYTGCDAATSRLAFSKSAAKERFSQFGVPTPPYVLIHYADDIDRIQRMVSLVGYPLVVKPDCQGSSLGISLVDRPEQLASALRLTFEYDSFAVIEQMIHGTEWTVGIVDREVLPAIQIRTPRTFFDFQAKYIDDATEYLFDVGWSSTDMLRIQDAALEACEALGTKGMVRVDLRVDEERQPWVLEINTIPGLTDHSLVPKAAARVGINFAELCERTVQVCRLARPRRPHILHNAAVRHPAREAS